MEKIIILNSDNKYINISNSNNTGFHLFTTIVSSIEILLSCLIFSTLIFHKKKLCRIDLLIIVKNIFFTFIFSLFLLFSVEKQIYEVNKFYNYSTSTISCFYLSFLYGLQVSINIEQYKSIRNPCYVIKYMINNGYNISIYSITSFIFSLFISIVPYFFQHNYNNIYEFIFKLTEKDYFDISFSKNKFLSPLIIFFFILLLYFYLQTKLFYKNLKEKSLLHLKYMNLCLLINNILYLFFAFLLLFIPLFSKIVNISKIIQSFFYVVAIGDSYLYIFRIFHSGFYYYYLNSTLIGCIFNCLCFGCFFNKFSFPSYNSSLLSSLTSKHTQSIYYFYSYLDYIVEDYILDTLDFILHTITVGLSIVYKDFQDHIYNFKSKNDLLSIELATLNSNEEHNNFENSKNQLKNILNKNDINSDLNENNEEDDLSNSSTYNFFKIYSKKMLSNKLENDLFSFNYCGDANIVITPLFVKESLESINLYQISKIDIINSLLSHKFLSLLMANSKKMFFKKLNNLIIKTYDDKLLIELHTDIIMKDNSEFLNDYFSHLNNSNINTFLSVLLGVFKVQINNLKEILIFVSKNPFVENVPRDFYNYWELMQFNKDKKKFNKLLSSKDADSFIITNENSLVSLNNVFQLDNFKLFQETIQNDIKFLMSISSSKFNLLILYYEYETNKNTSKNSIFSKIRNKLINDSNSTSDIFKNKKISVSNTYFSLSNNTSNYNNSLNKNIINNISEDTDKDIFTNIDNRKAIDDDISDIPLISNEIQNIVMTNGFESSYNHYKGIIYFRWDNVFYQNKRLSKSFYFDYVNELIQLFSD